jgi:hypothetical protein
MSTHTLHRHEERVVAHDFTIVFRLLAAIAAGVLIMFSLIALARIDWGSEWMDAAPVQVADVTFTPIVAIAFGGAGLLALLAAASRDRTSKIVMGALLLCAGVVAFIAQSDSDRVILQDGRAADRVILEDAHGWLLVAVGAALVIAALAMSWSAERNVERRRVVDVDEAPSSSR